jgi:hypothetical protein
MPSWYCWRIAGSSAIRRAATVLPMPPPASVYQDRGHINVFELANRRSLRRLASR